MRKALIGFIPYQGKVILIIMSAVDTLLGVARQLEQFSSHYVKRDGQHVANPINLSLIKMLRAHGMTLEQRRYLMRIASVTAHQDIADISFNSFWHLFRDVVTKRVSSIYFVRRLENAAENDLKSIRDLVVFGRITAANYRVLTGAGPLQPCEQRDAGRVTAESFTDFVRFLDYFEGHILGQLEGVLAQVTGTTRDVIAADIDEQIALITAHVRAGDVSDMNGLEILGPIDAAQYNALAFRRRPGPAPQIG